MPADVQPTDGDLARAVATRVPVQFTMLAAPDRAAFGEYALEPSRLEASEG